MYQVIARKYRPQSFDELIGQEHIRATLENAVTQRRIAHGYIFSGQRGTGKTTVARIMARCLNCEQGPTATPCGQCSSCREIAAGNSIDVLEIDAASNRGINEMRELRENVRYRPARDRYKVFIVDEAHQITSEAFNALLKTLEEPPEWVVFILCTTEVHKIPSTIASRCQQFSFRSVAFAELVTRMEWIAKQEGIEAGPEALSVLAQAGEGSVRDSLSALDQAIACCGSTIDAAEVRRLVGLFSLEALSEVTDALAASDAPRMLEIVDELERNGRSLQHYCRELARYFRNLLVVKLAGAGTRLVSASAQEQARLAEIAKAFSEADLTRYLKLTLDLYRDMQESPQPRLHMEVGLLRLVHAGKMLPIEEALASLGPETPSSSKAAMRAISSPPSPLRVTPREGPSPFERDASRKTSAAPAAPPAVTATAADEAAPLGSIKEQLLAWLSERSMTFSADAVQHAEIVESAAEITFTAPAEYAMALRSQDTKKAIEAVKGRPMRVKVVAGASTENTTGSTEPVPMRAPAAPAGEEEVSRRALSHPEVQRFQELFPNSQVRQVRDLKE